ncbi:MAG: ECF transporter S component [Oscillospiraceae bacterium]
MKQTNTQTIVGIGILTAIVIVLQSMAVAIRFGTFSITLVLIPIVVGAALYGWKAGAWLGLVFGVVVLFTDSAAFMMINAPGTIITCILKGVLAGLVSGVVYKALEKKNQWLAVITAAVVCPIVNTGVFLVGCMVFFLDTIKEWAAGAGFESVGTYLVVGFVGLNFLIEMGVNIVLSSAIVRILNVVKSKIVKHA